MCTVGTPHRFYFNIHRLCCRILIMLNLEYLLVQTLCNKVETTPLPKVMLIYTNYNPCSQCTWLLLSNSRDNFSKLHDCSIRVTCHPAMFLNADEIVLNCSAFLLLSQLWYKTVTSMIHDMPLYEIAEHSIISIYQSF